MPSLFTSKRSKTLPIAALLLHFSIHTLAAPFTPITGRPIPRFNGGLNLYPRPQEDIEDYAFNEGDSNFGRDFHKPVEGIQQQQHELRGEFSDGFTNEFQRMPSDDHYQWNKAHETALTGGDIFQKSGSSDVEGRGKLRITPGGRRRRPFNPASKNHNSFADDIYYPYPSQNLPKRDLDLDLGLDLLDPQTVCDFLHLPGCSPGLTLPVELLDLPIVSIEVEHTELSYQIMEGLDTPDTADIVDNFSADPEIGSPFASLKAPAPQNPEASVPVFLKIGFLPSAAAAFGVNQDAVGFLDMPISGIPLSGIPADVPYTETLVEYHEVQTICITREIGPFVVCERVYGEEPEQGADVGVPIGIDLEVSVADDSEEVVQLDLDLDPASEVIVVVNDEDIVTLQLGDDAATKDLIDLELALDDLDTPVSEVIILDNGDVEEVIFFDDLETPVAEIVVLDDGIFEEVVALDLTDPETPFDEIIIIGDDNYQRLVDPNVEDAEALDEEALNEDIEEDAEAVEEEALDEDIEENTEETPEALKMLGDGDADEITGLDPGFEDFVTPELEVVIIRDSEGDVIFIEDFETFEDDEDDEEAISLED